jgi:arabinose-5-phosphate isomerase
MIIEKVKEVLKIEAQAILDLTGRVGPNFEKVVRMILKAKGRVILTGMGKSGLVARKISATLNSTGTPSLFLHPAEAIHGDLGIVTKDDVVVAVSHSGKTTEINNILPLIKNLGAKVVSFTGALESPMAMGSDLVIDVGVERKPVLWVLRLPPAPLLLLLGDALAVAPSPPGVSVSRTSKVSSRRKPGERLETKVRDVMLTEDHIPMVSLLQSRAALREIDAKGIGATLVVDGDRKLSGIITDGDIRRAMLSQKNLLHLKVEKIMSPSPKTIDEDQTAAEALAVMELYGITHLAIVDSEKRVKGLLHLHDLFGREDFRLNGVNKAGARSHHRPHNAS